MQQDEQIITIVSYYQDLKEDYQQERLVELLREVQEVYGFIPEDILPYLYEELSVKPVVVRSILKYFPSLYTVKRRKITLCVGPHCSEKESAMLADKIREEIKILRKSKEGEVFTFTTQNCLKQCRKAPNLKIDDQIYSNVRVEDIKKIFING